jgi:hypothetical protein
MISTGSKEQIKCAYLNGKNILLVPEAKESPDTSQNGVNREHHQIELTTTINASLE